MSLRKSTLAASYYRIIDDRLLPVLKGHAISPNQCSLIGLMLAAMVPIGFYVHPLLGLGLIVVSGALDTLDGYIARHGGAASSFGAFIDSNFDRISDFFYLSGIWVLFWPMPGLLLSSSLIFLSFLATFMISYVKARAAALGGLCDVGWMERGYRTIYLIVWVLLICLLGNQRILLLWSGLVLYLVLASLTVYQRITHARSELAP